MSMHDQEMVCIGSLSIFVVYFCFVYIRVCEPCNNARHQTCMQVTFVVCIGVRSDSINGIHRMMILQLVRNSKERRVDE